MNDASRSALRQALNQCLQTFRENPGMSGSEILQQGRSLAAWKQARGIDGIFTDPPRMMTATLDDGIGQGLTLIHCFAELAGVTLIPLGLMQAPETIINECRRQQPDILGLTVLQYGTEELLCNDIIPHLPDRVQVIVGGPVFKTMDKAALAAKPYRVLNDVRAFLDHMLNMAVDR
ncbi:MAG: hypothetical protein SWH68_12685 [Thermodesulfobacteriota bacterium]|nr:hypothetical protein [Thermodesulfobacteriota bacterium]